MNDRNTSGNRKKSRKRGGRQGGDSGNKSGNKSGGGNKKRQRNKAAKIDLGDFWGDPTSLPDADVEFTAAPDVKAVVSSLGRPPVPGHETPAEHWFSLVYERSAMLAGALAVAAGHQAEDNDEEPEAEKSAPDQPVA